jgi:hypothetical protein
LIIVLEEDAWLYSISCDFSGYHREFHPIIDIGLELEGGFESVEFLLDTESL